MEASCRHIVRQDKWPILTARKNTPTNSACMALNFIVTDLLLRTQWICLHQRVTITDRLYSGMDPEGAGGPPPLFLAKSIYFLHCIQCLKKYF